MLLIVEEITVDKSFSSGTLHLFPSEMGGNSLILLTHAYERGLNGLQEGASPEVEVPQLLGWAGRSLHLGHSGAEEMCAEQKREVALGVA